MKHKPLIELSQVETIVVKLPRITFCTTIGCTILLCVALTVLLFCDGKSGAKALTLVDIANKSNKPAYTMQDFVKTIAMRDEAATAEPNSSLSSVLMFNEQESAISKAINNEVFEISKKYTNASSLPEEFKDPLFNIALSCVEWGGSSNHTICWSGAFPSLYLKESLYSAEGVRNLTIGDVAEGCGGVTSFWNRSYYGPHQMTQSYGVAEAAIPEDLNRSETESIKSHYNGGSPSYLDMSTVCSDVKAGDRFNWADACNRTSGKLATLWNNFKDKDGARCIDNKYSYMALMAIAHNSGEGCLYGDGTELVNTFYWWSFYSNKDIYEYCRELSNPEIIKDLKARATKSINNFRKGEPLNVRPGCSDVVGWLNGWSAKGWVDSSHYITSRQGGEKVTYPVQTLYAYFVLEGLYSGQ